MSQSRIEFKPTTGRIGAEVSGIDLRDPISAEAAQTLIDGFAANQVLFFRDQPLDPEGLKRFGRLFGELLEHTTIATIPGHTNVVPIYADENSKFVAGEQWHSDISCDEQPPLGSVLNMHIVPPVGGDTCFSSMYAAYEALSPAMQKFLEPLTAMHDGEWAFSRYANMEMNGKPAFSGIKFPASVHPVVRTHPVTKRKALYVNEAFVTKIVELSEAESRTLLRMLFEHVQNPNFQTRFTWRQHSMAFWDNRCVQHLAVKDYFPHVRSGYRINIIGDKPY